MEKPIKKLNYAANSAGKSKSNVFVTSNLIKPKKLTVLPSVSGEIFSLPSGLPDLLSPPPQHIPYSIHRICPNKKIIQKFHQYRMMYVYKYV
jgi:hypothetical protein